MSRRSRRSWGRRELNSEVRARFSRVAELAAKGYEPKTIATSTRLPLALVEEILAMSLQTPSPGGGDG